MDFSLSNEHLMTQNMVCDFAQKEVAPVIKEFDRKQEPIPGVLDRLGELGILGICYPVKYGGQGMDYISLGLACEELEALDTSLRVPMSVHTGLVSMTIFQWGTEGNKNRNFSCLLQVAKNLVVARSQNQAWAQTWRPCARKQNVRMRRISSMAKRCGFRWQATQILH